MLPLTFNFNKKNVILNETASIDVVSFSKNHTKLIGFVNKL